MIAPKILWSQNFAVPDTYALFDVVTSVVASKDGSIFILTKESLTKFSAGGSLIWQKPQGGTALFIDQNDYLYQASRYSGSTTTTNGSIYKLNTDSCY